jgi:hypothetical protein
VASDALDDALVEALGVGADPPASDVAAAPSQAPHSAARVATKMLCFSFIRSAATS